MSRNVLVYLTDRFTKGTTVNTPAVVCSMLRRMGYTPHTVTMDRHCDNAYDLISTIEGTHGEIEFIVIPRPLYWYPGVYPTGLEIEDLWNGMIKPVLVCNMVDPGSWTALSVGVTYNGDGNSYEYVDFEGVGELPVLSRYWDDNQNANWPIRQLANKVGSPEGEDMSMWVMEGGTYPVVYDATGSSGGAFSSSCFPLSLQYLINEANLTPPAYPGGIFLDIDDIPSDGNVGIDPSYITTVEDMYAIAADLKEARMVAAIGPHASPTVGSRNELEVWEGRGVLEPIRRNLSIRGGPFVPIEHQGNTYWTTQEIAGKPSGGQTKQDIDDFYREHVANMAAFGIPQGTDADGLNSYGYHYANTNRINNKAMELTTPGVSVLADPAEATARQGYGMNAWRFAGNANQRVAGVSVVTTGEQLDQINRHMGAQIIDSGNPISSLIYTLPLAGSESEYARTIWQHLIQRGLASFATMYFHGSNYYNYAKRDPLCPAYNTMVFMKRIMAFCTDTLVGENFGETLPKRLGVGRRID